MKWSLAYVAVAKGLCVVGTAATALGRRMLVQRPKSFRETKAGVIIVQFFPMADGHEICCSRYVAMSTKLPNEERFIWLRLV